MTILKRFFSVAENVEKTLPLSSINSVRLTKSVLEEKNILSRSKEGVEGL